MAITETPIDPARWHNAIESGSDQLQLRYDQARDFFALTLGDPRPTSSHDDSGLSIQIDLYTSEVTGLHIYAFEGAYLPQHPDFAEWWRQMKSTMEWRPFAHHPLDDPLPRMPSNVARVIGLPSLAG